MKWNEKVFDTICKSLNSSAKTVNAQNAKCACKIHTQLYSFTVLNEFFSVIGKTVDSINSSTNCWVTRNHSFFTVIPWSCSRVWTGPARQTSVLLCWVPSEKGTILYACLQEWPTHPFEKHHLSALRNWGDWTVNETESRPYQVPVGRMVGGSGLFTTLKLVTYVPAVSAVFFLIQNQVD